MRHPADMPKLANDFAPRFLLIVNLLDCLRTSCSRQARPGHDRVSQREAKTEPTIVSVPNHNQSGLVHTSKSSETHPSDDSAARLALRESGPCRRELVLPPPRRQD
jgi:hypothetical protein